MASEFTLPLTAEGAVTAPTGTFVFIEPSAESQTFLDVGPATVLEIPELGWAVADGVNPLRLITKGGVYDCGGIGPNSGVDAAAVSPVLTPSAAKATATMTFTAATRPANNDTFQIGGVDGTLFTVTWKDTLSTSGDAFEIKRGATLADCISNAQSLINGTGTDGTNFYFHQAPFFGHPLGVDYHYFETTAKIEVSNTTATVITFRCTTSGPPGNSCQLIEGTDGGASWAVVSFSGGSTGTGAAPGVGIYRYFYTWFRSVDGAETYRSVIASCDNGGIGQIAISALTASADTTFDYIRIYRTTDRGVEFYLLGAVPRASSTFTDDVEDKTLARSLPWDDLAFRSYPEGMPPRGLALALWKSRLWSLGARLHADYVRGTVAVTETSSTATLSVKGGTTLMRGRTLQVAATSETYNILAANESARTLTLDRGYEGTTNGTASYTIMDDYDACAIRASVPFLYNQWPVDQSPGRVDTDDPRGGTALLATRSRLFAFSATSIAAVTGDGPESWEISKVGQGVGCVSPRMIVGVEGGGVFLSHDGFYAISPDETLVCISSPKAKEKEVARGIDGTVARISWADVDQGYSYYDPVERVVVFGLPLDGSTVPNYEVVFDLQNSTWTTFKRAEWTDSCNATLPGGAPAILSGDREGTLWHVDIGESDGFYGTEAVQTLTGAQTVRTLTVTGTPFSTTGDAEKGKPVLVLYANGTTVAYGKVASNTNAALTLAEDLATAPAAGDQVVVGGIAWQAKSGFPTFGEEYRSKILKSVTVRHAPTTRGEYFFSFATDGGSFNLCPVGTSKGSLTDTDGKVRHFTQWPGDTHAINLRGFKPGGRATIRGGVFEVVVRENGTR